MRDRSRVPSVTAPETVGRNRPRITCSFIECTATQRKGYSYAVNTAEKQMGVSGTFLFVLYFTPSSLYSPLTVPSWELCNCLKSPTKDESERRVNAFTIFEFNGHIHRINLISLPISV